IAARLYPAEDVGVASAIVSALSLTFQLSMLGMGSAIIRFYPDYGEKAVGSALVVTSVASLVISIVYGLIMLTSKSFKELGWGFLGLFVVLSVLETVYNIFYTYAVARRIAEHAFLQSLLFSGRFLFLVFLASLGTLGMVIAFGLGLLLALGYVMIMVGLPKVMLNGEFLREALHFSAGNYFAGILNVIPTYLMPTLILSMLGKEEAAYFYIAFSIGNIILLVPNAINTSFFVEGSHGLRNIKETLKRAVAYSYAYLLVALVGVWLFGGYVLRFFGEGYAGGLPLLRLMVIGGFPAVVVGFASTVLNIQKRVRVLMAVNALRASMFLGLSYLFVPRIGILGVGLGWVGSHFGALGAMGVMFRKEIQKHISRSVPGEA
ncbi:lipopolysaccharide biosynthesis protein, partial [Thermococcus sibiricus]